MLVFAAISGDDIISKLVPNWVSFVVQLLAFLVLVFIVIRFGYKPVKKILKKRQDYIEENIKQTEIAKNRANDNIVRSEETLNASKKQANEIIASAKEEALKEKERIINETNLEVERMKEDAQKDIEQSKVEAQEEIRREMVNIALDASSEVLGRNINTKDNAKLAEDFIRSVDN